MNSTVMVFLILFCFSERYCNQEYLVCRNKIAKRVQTGMYLTSTLICKKLTSFVLPMDMMELVCENLKVLVINALQWTECHHRWNGADTSMLLFPFFGLWMMFGVSKAQNA